MRLILQSGNRITKSLIGRQINPRTMSATNGRRIIAKKKLTVEAYTK
jgi:hypothetical protein